MTDANLLDDFPAPICRTGVYGAVNYCNRAWLEFTGLALQEQQGDGWTSIIHPDDRDGCLAVYMRSVTECKPFESEYRLRRWDGEYRWVLDIGRPYYNSRHEYCGYMRVCYDNTDRRLSSASLKTLTGGAHVFSVNGRHAPSLGVHHDIGEALTALVVHLALLHTELPREADDAQKHLKSALELVQIAVEALSNPEETAAYTASEATGLNLALMSYCDEATAQYNIPINYSGVEVGRMDKNASIAMMRLLQESLADAQAKAMASRIHVALHFGDGQLRLVIEDNGNGSNLPFGDHSGRSDGAGSIGELFRSLGGEVEAVFRQGKGSSLIGILPV